MTNTLPFRLGLVSALACAVLAGPAIASLQTDIVASGFNQPLYATAPDGDARLFVVEKGGLIKIIQNGAVLPTPFLNISSTINTSGERGLLGMAFDPDYANNRRF